MVLTLGLVCINTILRELKIFNSRSCIRRTFTIEKAKSLSILNIRDIIKLIEWNEKNNIYCFRLSSDIFPHFTDTETEKYDMSFASNDLRMAGDCIKRLNHRILMHPGQYNQVGAIDKKVFDKTAEDLKYHADILDEMGIDYNGVLIVHGGGLYNDKGKTIARWIEQFYMLPENVKRRLVIENCERSYNIEDCLYISSKCNIPVVFDIHHYNCYGMIHGIVQRPLDELFPEIIRTWGKRKPLMHISEQALNLAVGAHSDYIS